MARRPASRKYQITINNPLEHGYTHDKIKNIMNDFSGMQYGCMCDEVGKEGTPHTHVYMVFNNAVMFTTLQKRYYGAHIEPANGSHQQNRDYIRKEGRWIDDDKSETNQIETFEEWGELPPERAGAKQEIAAIYELLKGGASDFEILEEYPSAMTKLDKVERARQTLREEIYKNEFRKLEVKYIYGETGVGKTRSVMEEYGYQNVHRISNYAHPFDTYKGQDVIIFEEFRGNLPIGDMLIYLDGYPTALPCRYADKQACFTKVYFITNIPLENQYLYVQRDSPETWEAFRRRIQDIKCMLPSDNQLFFDWTEEIED